MKHIKNTSMCWACGLELFTIARLTQHLNKNKPNKFFTAIRRMHLWSDGLTCGVLTFCVSNDEFEIIKNRQLDETRALTAKGYRAHHALRLAFRICGPVLR